MENDKCIKEHKISIDKHIGRYNDTIYINVNGLSFMIDVPYGHSCEDVNIIVSEGEGWINLNTVTNYSRD